MLVEVDTVPLMDIDLIHMKDISLILLMDIASIATSMGIELLSAGQE